MALPAIPKPPGLVLEDENWRLQKQNALQAALACNVYFSEHGCFPAALTDALEIMAHDPSQQKRMRRFFEFTDPADGTRRPWAYFPGAMNGTDGILISSPESPHRLRVVCTATGAGFVVTEESYQHLMAKS